MLNDILIIDQQWLPNQSDFPPISWPWYRTWPSPIMSGFHEAFATGMPAGNAYPSGHLVPTHHCGTCLCSNCWDQIPRTCHVFTRLFTSNTPWYFLDLAYMMFPLVLYHPPPLFWDSVLLYLRSPKGGFCSITDALSCSCVREDKACFIEIVYAYLVICYIFTCDIFRKNGAKFNIVIGIYGSVSHIPYYPGLYLKMKSKKTLE